MARPLGIEYPGAVYHVAARGNARQDHYNWHRYYDPFDLGGAQEMIETKAPSLDLPGRC